MREFANGMLRRSTHAVALVGLGICTGAIAQGPESEALNVDMAECIELDSEAARVACYQNQVEAALRERGPAAESGQAAPTAAPARERTPAPVPASTSRSSSAVEPAAVRRNEPDSGDSERHEIYGTITALRETVPDRWTITLDNGQVWRMERSKRYPFRVGLDVMLYSTRWGDAYRLTAPEHGGFVTVERAR